MQTKFTQHMNLDTAYKKDTLEKPMTPSRWVSQEPIYYDITRIRVSNGGGSSYYEYAVRMSLDEFKPNTMVKVPIFNGTEKLINTSYVVSVDNSYQIAVARLDSKNSAFPVGMHEYFYLVEDGHTFSLI